LFVRMVQVLFRPRKMHHCCSACGLSEHESDAVHCKRCGTLLTPESGAGPDDRTCASGSR
jgi:voltage-gated potassium channel